MSPKIRLTPSFLIALVSLVAAALILGFTVLGPNNRAELLEGTVVPHSGGQAIGPGQKVEIDVKGLSALAAPVNLDIWAKDSGGLRLMPGAVSPDVVKPDRVRLFLPGPMPDRLVLTNNGNTPVTPGRIRARNYVARNTGIPRFAVLLPGSEHRGTVWEPWRLPALVGSAVLMLLLGAVIWLRGGARINDPRFWALSVPPGLGLVAAAAAAGAGYRLLLAFDTYLLLFSPGLLLFLPLLAKAADRWTGWCLAVLTRTIIRTKAFLAAKSRRLPGFALLVLVTAIIFVPAIILPSPPAKVPFDNEWLVKLNKEEPYVVAIGNSMIGSRIDVKRFSELLGKPVDINWISGTGPRLWYLLFKSYVCQAKKKPKYVMLLICDYELVWPRKGWKNEWDIRQVEALTPDKYRYDPEFAEVCLKDPTFRQRMQYRFREWFNVSNYAFGAKEWLATLVMDLTVPPDWVKESLRQYQAVFWRNHINYRFDLDRLRPSVFVPRTEAENKDFGQVREAIEKSFLPRFIRLAKENGIQLIVVRMQHRMFNGKYRQKQPEEMKHAVAEQKRYMREHGVLFYDFTGDPEITDDLYGAGDHIGWDHRRTRWTEIMFERIGGWFK